MTTETISYLLNEAYEQSDVEYRNTITQIFINSPKPIIAIQNFSEEFIEWLNTGCNQLNISSAVNVPVWIIPNARFGIRVFEENNQFNIICNQGTLMTITFVISHYIVLNKISQLIDSNKLSTLDKNDLKQFSKDLLTYGNALLLLNTSSSFPFPDFRNSFSEDEMHCLNNMLFFSELFLFRHENAHISLNHFDISPSVNRWYDLQNMIVPEVNDEYKFLEFEADLYALKDVDDNLRSYLILGAHFVLSIVASHETYLDKTSKTHPFALNRIENILSQKEYNVTKDFTGFQEVLLNSKKTFDESFKFSGISIEEKINLYFKGHSRKYIANFIEWVGGYVNVVAAKYNIHLRNFLNFEK